ncbi:tripartite tricarboxylate transporter substrate binding protein, partial [Verticiella sediminum]
AAAEAAADGYTVLLGTVGTHAINPTLYGNLPYDPAKAFTPVAMVLAGPNVLVVNPDVPARSVAELTALAKRKPGALNMGSSGSGSSIHLSGEMYKHLAGVDLTHVPYRGGGPALTDLIGGRIDLMFDNLSTSLPLIKDGRLRPLAVTGPQRVPSLPDVPTMREAGVPDYEAIAWMGLFVPAGTPADIVERLNTATREAQKSPAVAARLAELGAEPSTLDAGEFGAFVAAETRRWPDVVRASGARAE